MRSPKHVAALLLLLVACASPHAHQPGAGSGIIAVSLSGEHSVVFVAPESGRTISRFESGGGPHELIASSDGARVYVADAGASSGDARGRTVSVIDVQRRSPASRHDLAEHRSPHDVRVSRDGSLLWVAVAASQAILELNARTGVLIRTWRTDVDGGWFVAVTPDDRKIYVPHLEGKSVTAIDRETGARKTVLAGGAQSGIDVSPDGRQVWVIDHDRQRINVIAAATDTVTAHVPLPSNAFGRLRFSPTGRVVVVVQEKRLSTIDAATLKETGAMELPLAAKVVTVSPDGTLAAVSHPADGAISIVDLAARRVRATYPVGKAPDGIYWFDAPS